MRAPVLNAGGSISYSCLHALPPVHPRRQPEEARQGHGQRRRRAAARSRGFDLRRRTRPARAPPPRHSSRRRASAKDRPRLYVRINGLATGLTDDDLDAVVAGTARRHHVSQGRGRRRGRPLRRQDHRARGDPRPARRRARHHRHRHRNRAGAVPRRHLCRLEQAAEGPDLGRRGSFGRARRRGQPRSRRQFPRAVSARAQPLPRRRGRSPGAGDRHGLCGFPERRGAAP